jgi:hypothetical protein
MQNSVSTSSGRILMSSRQETQFFLKKNYGCCPNVNKINPEGVELFFEFFGRLLQAVVNFIAET